jgi:hypothetical protein
MPNELAARTIMMSGRQQGLAPIPMGMSAAFNRPGFRAITNSYRGNTPTPSRALPSPMVTTPHRTGPAGSASHPSAARLAECGLHLGSDYVFASGGSQVQLSSSGLRKVQNQVQKSADAIQRADALYPVVIRKANELYVTGKDPGFSAQLSGFGAQLVQSRHNLARAVAEVTGTADGGLGAFPLFAVVALLSLWGSYYVVKDLSESWAGIKEKVGSILYGVAVLSTIVAGMWAYHKYVLPSILRAQKFHRGVLKTRADKKLAKWQKKAEKHGDKADLINALYAWSKGGSPVGNAPTPEEEDLIHHTIWNWIKKKAAAFEGTAATPLATPPPLRATPPPLPGSTISDEVAQRINAMNIFMEALEDEAVEQNTSIEDLLCARIKGGSWKSDQRLNQKYNKRRIILKKRTSDPGVVPPQGLASDGFQRLWTSNGGWEGFVKDLYPGLYDRCK